MGKNSKTNEDYWRERFRQLEEEQYQHSAAYYQDLQKQFRMATNDMQMDIEHWYGRLAENNDLSLAGAKRMLKKNELEEFHWSVEQYIKAGEENALDRRWMKQLENASARHHISYLEAMKIQAQHHAELLSTLYEGGVTDFLHKSFSDNYYRTAFEIAKGTGVGSNLAVLDTRKIDTVIRRPWAQDGVNFSDRIWSNKQKLVNTLHTELTQNIIRGASPRQAIGNIAKTMEVSRSQAGRLVMTESAAISATAQKECFKALGVEQYQILVSLDDSTCDICQELDGKVFDQKDFEVGVTAPPFHPNCRCTQIPYFDDEFTEGEERAARDEATGKTVYVDGKLNYKEWKEQNLIEKNISYEGVPKTWEKLNDTSSILNVNPTKSSVNCVNCTIAYEMRRRGYAVVAGDAIKRLMREPFSGWKSPIIMTIERKGDALTEIKNSMKKWGDNSRAQISVVWNRKRQDGPDIGHSFIAEQHNGSTLFLDVQTGRAYNEDIFKRATDHEIYFCRIDTLEINDLGATACQKE